MQPRDVAALCVRPDAGAHLLSLLLQMDAKRLTDGLHPRGDGAAGTIESMCLWDDAFACLPWTASPGSAPEVAAAMVAAGAPRECLEALLRHVARAWRYALPATAAAAARELAALQTEAPAVAAAALPMLHALLRVLQDQPAARRTQGASAPSGNEAAAKHWKAALCAAGRVAVVQRCGDVAAAVLAAEAQLGLYGCLMAEQVSLPNNGHPGTTASITEWLWALGATPKPLDARGKRARSEMSAALASPAASPARTAGRLLEDLLRAGRVGNADELTGQLTRQGVAKAAARALGCWPGCTEPAGLLHTGWPVLRDNNGPRYNNVAGKRGLLHHTRCARPGLS
jgi:hypothetical protein